MIIIVENSTLLMNYLKSELFNENLHLPLWVNERNYNPMIIEIKKILIYLKVIESQNV